MPNGERLVWSWPGRLDLPETTETSRSTPMQKYLIAGLLVAGMVSPAFAAEFYVAQSASTHKCSVTSKKPDGKSMMLVGTETFKSKPDAMKAMKGMAECKA
jgi:hypothetical protein